MKYYEKITQFYIFTCDFFEIVGFKSPLPYVSIHVPPIKTCHVMSFDIQPRFLGFSHIVLNQQKSLLCYPFFFFILDHRCNLQGCSVSTLLSLFFHHHQISQNSLPFPIKNKTEHLNVPML